MDALAFLTQEKAKCVTWYMETQFNRTVRKRFQKSMEKNLQFGAQFFTGWKALTHTEMMKIEMGVGGLR